MPALPTCVARAFDTPCKSENLGSGLTRRPWVGRSYWWWQVYLWWSWPHKEHPFLTTEMPGRDDVVSSYRRLDDAIGYIGPPAADHIAYAPREEAKASVGHFQGTVDDTGKDRANPQSQLFGRRFG